MNASLVSGIFILFFFLAVCVFGFAITPYPPSLTDYGNIFQNPSIHHLCGTDHLGRDVLSRLLIGTRTTLVLAIGIALINILIALFVGSASGFFGGKLDTFIMRLVDSLIALPGFLLAICFLGIFGGGVKNLVVFLVLTGWAGLSRIIRNEVIVVKNMDFIISNISLGFGTFRIIRRHILPHIIPSLLIIFIMTMTGELFSIVSLSFLGLGISPQIPEWGAILNDARPYFLSSPGLLVFPTLFVFFAVLGLHFLADGVREYMDRKKILIEMEENGRLFRVDEAPIGDSQ
ncbi:ABC transporter permease [bacterium]|nr:ABC transporter permease [bacterium]